MGGRGHGAPSLDGVRERISRWRVERGGRGIPLPEEIWSDAVEVARVHGVKAVAQALRVDRDRLAARLARSDGPAQVDNAAAAFVEVNTSRWCTTPKTIVRLEGGGDRLEIELGDGACLDIVALARNGG
jgi:hypothetical protein